MVPGVGAFGDCMGELRKRDLIKPIMNYIAAAARRCSASASACRC